MAFLTGWSYRKKITIGSDNIGENLSNFPVYVDLSNLGTDFFTNVANDGVDIRVTLSDGETEVPVEIVSVDKTGETGELYFLATSISSTVDTDFYIYYGNSSATLPAPDSIYGSESVWIEYLGVWHFKEVTGNIIDSTGNDNDGTPAPNAGDLTVIGKSGSGLEVELANTEGYDIPHLTQPTTFTYSAWVKYQTTETGDWFSILGSWQNGWGDWFLHRGNGYKPCYRAYDGSTGVERLATTAPSANTWAMLHAVYDGTNINHYIDGTASGSNTMVNSLRWASFVGRNVSGKYFNGSLDEIRVRTGSVSANWVSAEYVNQNTPSGFYSVGLQEAGAVGTDADSERGLYVSGYSTSNAERGLYITGSHTLSTDYFNVEFGLAESGNGEIGLYIHGKTNTNAERGLYISGVATSTGERGLYIEGYDSSEGERSLYIQGSADTTADMLLYIEGRLGGNAESNLYIAGIATGYSDVGLYVHGVSSSSEDLGLYMEGRAIYADMGLYIEGNIASEFGLYIEGEGGTAKDVGLYISGIDTTSSERGLYVVGKIDVTVDINLYLEGYGTEQKERGLYVWGYVSTYSDIGLYAYGKDIGSESVGLYIQGSKGTGAEFSLYIEGRAIFEDIGLYIQGSQSDMADMKLYVWGKDYGSSEASLYVWGTNTDSSDIGLYVEGKNVVVASVSLYIAGRITTQIERGLYIGGIAETYAEFGLYIVGKTGAEIGLYIVGMGCPPFEDNRTNWEQESDTGKWYNSNRKQYEVDSKKAEC